MTLSNQSILYKNIYIGVCIIGFLILLLQVLMSPVGVVFDEYVFHANLLLYQKYGLSKTFLMNIQKQAPGPLYQIIHGFFGELTQHRPFAIRLTNLGFLGLMMLLLYWGAKVHFGVQNTLEKTLSLITIPWVWLIGGIALTELPAMLFVGLFLVTYFYLPTTTHLVHRGLLVVVCGVSLALAILGRSPFLMLIGGVVLLIFTDFKRYFWVNSLILGITFVGFIPVFWLWQGLVPPRLAYPNSFNFFFGFLALAYASFVFFILEPKWLYFKRTHFRYYALLLFTSLIINYKWHLFLFLPLQSVLLKVKNPTLITQLSYVAPCLFLPFSFLFLCSFYRRLREQRHDPRQLFLYVCYLLIMATFVKITHTFSPRYVIQALPLTFLMVIPYFRFTRLKILLAVCGILFGAYSLHSYYLKIFVYH
jgi:4-amino-4-deoxy-L-arabinose transferase-like glycosyltransferase